MNTGRTLVATLALVLSLACTGRGPDPLIDEAREAMVAGRPEKAAQALQRLERHRPPTPGDRLMRADVAQARQRPDEALAELAAIPDGLPESPQARLMEGRIEVRRQRLRPAEAALRKAVDQAPDLVQAHRELIYVFGQQVRRGALVAQIEALANVASLEHDDVWLWCMAPDLLGWIPQESVEVLRGFLRADPEDRWSRLALADQLRRSSRYDEAKQVLEALPEEDVEARVVRARVALDLGDLETAEGLVRQGPTDLADLARVRGRLALARRDAPAAIAAYRAAEAADPGHRETALGLGQSLRLADDSEAERWLERAAKLDALGTLLEREGTPIGRSDPTLARRLGDAYRELNEVPRARAWYRLAVARDPLDTDAQAALHRLGPD